MATRNSTRRRNKAPIPDFEAILGAFAKAHALVEVCSLVLTESCRGGPESVALRLGVEACGRAYDQLDRAIGRLDTAQKRPR
jgi:hypothetical protein